MNKKKPEDIKRLAMVITFICIIILLLIVLIWLTHSKDKTSPRINNVVNEINNNTKLIDNVYVSLQNIFEWPSNANSNSDGYCLGGKSHIGILSDGSVIICCLDGEGESNLGNIFYEDLSFILNSEKYHNIINYFKNNKCYLDICKKCTYKNRFK